MTQHDFPAVAGLVLGALEPHEAEAIEAHLTGCAQCRAERDRLVAAREALAHVPPEFFLDGPPNGHDRLLGRTLKAVRGQVAEPRARATRAARPRRLLLAAATAVAVFVVGGVVGRATVQVAGPVPSGTPSVVPSVVPSGSPTVVPSGTRTLQAADASTGVRMTAVLTPAAGWVRLRATVGGVAAGTKCNVFIVSKDGRSVLAGSWLVSPTGEERGTVLDGSALVAPADVAAVTVSTVDGQVLVSAVTG